MVNFTTAIEQGISAAAAARSEEIEINEVVKSLALSVESASNNVVTLSLSQRTLKTSSDLLSSIAFVLAGTKYHALVLKTKSTPPEILEVAKWGQDGKGYPVKIGISSDEYNCPNREALEQALLTLVSTSEFGEIMRKFSSPSAEKEVQARVDISEGRISALKAGYESRKAGTTRPTSAAAGARYRHAVNAAAKSASGGAVKAGVKPAAKASVKSSPKGYAKVADKPTAKSASKVATKPAANSARKSTTIANSETVKSPATKTRSRSTI